MKKQLFYIILLFLAVGLSSCVKEVILDAKEDPVLAVYCVLTQDSVQTLKLSWTKGASQTEAPRVTEASAVLTDLTENSEAGRFTRTSESDWQLEYAAIPGHNYRLEVTIPGHETVWAEQAMPGGLHWGFEAAGFLGGYSSEDVGSWLNLDIKRLTSYVSWVDGITFGEVTVEGLFYHIVFSCPVWAYAEKYDAELGKFVPVKNLCTDYPYVDNFNLTGKVRSGAGVPEVVNSPDLWIGSYIDFYTIGYSMHRDFLRFPKREDWARQLENPKSVPHFAIDGDFTDVSSSSSNWWELNRVFFDAMSEDYDRYLCEAYQQYYAEQSSDISTIYLRDNLFTNIHGGLGIFGCVTRNREYYYYELEGSRGIPWLRPRVRIQVFGPNYEPEDDEEDPGNTMP